MINTRTIIERTTTYITGVSCKNDVQQGEKIITSYKLFVED